MMKIRCYKVNYMETHVHDLSSSLVAVARGYSQLVVP